MRDPFGNRLEIHAAGGLRGWTLHGDAVQPRALAVEPDLQLAAAGGDSVST